MRSTAPPPSPSGGSTPGVAPLPAHTPVLVVGAGFAGLGAAHRLGQDGHDVLVLERADDVGGVWRDNTYPGAGCDVQSHLYSFSFAPNPTWTQAYSLQPEILGYLRDVADRLDLRRRIRFGVEVVACRWDDPAALWRVTTTAGDLTADVVVLGAGPLVEPKLPDVPGLDSFPGPVMHTARWDHSVDLAGARVAVVGTGASAIQVVPQLAATAAELTVLQRTPAWVLPRLNHGIPPWRRRAYARFPALQQAARALTYAGREALVVGFVGAPSVMRGAEVLARRYLHAKIRDPHLRAVLTPDYRAGCKRVLVSDDYYDALARPHVEVVPSALAAVEGSTVVAADGTRREVDVVVVATGFEASDMPAARFVHGVGGVRLADLWAREGMQALRGTTVSGFPNLFFLIGPNTGLGHSSMVHVIESQLEYVRDALRRMRDDAVAVLDPAPAAQDRWNADVQRRMRRTVWATGCRAWYQDAHGRLTVTWPGTTVRLRRTTRRVDLDEYVVRHREPRPDHHPRPSRAASGTDTLAGTR